MPSSIEGLHTLDPPGGSGARPTDRPGPTRSAPRRRLPPLLPLVLALLAVGTISFNSVRISGWTISDLLMMAAFGAACLTILAGRGHAFAGGEMRKSPPAFVAGGVVLFTGAILSCFGSVEPMESVIILVRLAWVTLGLFWVLRILTRNRIILGYFINAFRVTILLAATAALLGQVGVLQLHSIDNNRQAAFFNHPNNLATCLAVGIPFLLLPNTPAGRDPRSKDHFFARLCMTAFTLIALGTTGSLTGTAGAIIALGTSVTLMVLTSSQRRRPIQPLTVIAIVVLVGLGLAAVMQSNNQVLERLGDMQTGQTRSHETRDDFNSMVMGEFHNRLVLGVGMDDRSNQIEFQDSNVTGANSGYNHNMYLRVLNGAGIPALVGLLIMLFLMLNHGLKLALKNGNDPMVTVAIAAVGSCLGAMANNLFQPAGYERYFWFPFLIIGVMWQLRREEIRQTIHASTPSREPGQADFSPELRNAGQEISRPTIRGVLQ